MIAPAYPAYKESGFEWLGRVPAHWKITRLKYLGEAIVGLTYDPSQVVDVSSGTLVLRSSNVKNGKVVLDDNVYVHATIPSELVTRVGDILICSRNGSRDLIGKNATIDVLSSGQTFGAFMTIFRSHHSRYIGWLLNSPLFKFQSGAFLTSTINQLTVGVLNNFEVPLPPKAEREKIVAFLDRETGKIDALVGEQERLIALLKEKRQAVISQAVTKGLDPTVPMKHSGVEWLGEVPAHWTVLPLSRITRSMCDGPFGSGLKSEHYVSAGARVIRLQNIRKTGFDGADAAFVDESYFESQLSGHDVRENDILIAGLGDERNTVGRACVAPDNLGPALVKADCFRFRTQADRVSPGFLAFQLTSGAEFDAGQLSSGSTRSRIPLSVMATRRVALPSLSEQEAIYQDLTTRMAALASLDEQATRAIALLRERRAALIAAAVTGKIDVREHAAVPSAQAA